MAESYGEPAHLGEMRAFRSGIRKDAIEQLEITVEKVLGQLERHEYRKEEEAAMLARDIASAVLLLKDIGYMPYILPDREEGNPVTMITVLRERSWLENAFHGKMSRDTFERIGSVEFFDSQTACHVHAGENGKGNKVQMVRMAVIADKLAVECGLKVEYYGFNVLAPQYEITPDGNLKRRGATA